LRVSNEKEHQKTNKKQNYIEGQRKINDFIETNGGFDGYDDEMSSYWTARNKLLPDIISNNSKHTHIPYISNHFLQFYNSINCSKYVLLYCINPQLLISTMNSKVK